MAQIKRTIDVTVDPRQYAYRKNRSTASAISTVLHLTLTHLEKRTHTSGSFSWTLVQEPSPTAMNQGTGGK